MKSFTLLPREEQYAPALAIDRVTLGPMASHSYLNDAKHLGFTLARYKFVAKMLGGKPLVAEIGAGDGFGAQVVKQAVTKLDLFAFDPMWDEWTQTWDIVDARLPISFYDGIYMVDVLEHIKPKDETRAMENVCASLTEDGVFIAGMPSIESQVYASLSSRKGHVNCKSGEVLRRDMLKYFRNVFLFGMNDEMLHVGFTPMCHYLFVLCVGVR